MTMKAAESPAARWLREGLPHAAALLAYVGALPILLLDDLTAARRGSGAPVWSLGVRMPLTILMETAFILALAAGLFGQ